MSVVTYKQQDGYLASGYDIVIELPNPLADGDMCICAINAYTQKTSTGVQKLTVTPPTGFTLLAEYNDWHPTKNYKLLIYYKYITNASGESVPYHFTMGGNAAGYYVASACMMVFANTGPQPLFWANSRYYGTSAYPLWINKRFTSDHLGGTYLNFFMGAASYTVINPPYPCSEMYQGPSYNSLIPARTMLDIGLFEINPTSLETWETAYPSSWDWVSGYATPSTSWGTFDLWIPPVSYSVYPDTITSLEALGTPELSKTQTISLGTIAGEEIVNPVQQVTVEHVGEVIVTTDGIKPDGRLMVIYEQVPRDIETITEEIPYWKPWMIKYVEYATLERCFGADTDGFIPSLRDYWKYRKEIGLQAAQRMQRLKLKDRGFQFGGNRCRVRSKGGSLGPHY